MCGIYGFGARHETRRAELQNESQRSPHVSPNQRRVLRERFLAQQQRRLAEDARLDDPAVAYQQLLAELESDHKDDEALLARPRAA